MNEIVTTACEQSCNILQGTSTQLRLHDRHQGYGHVICNKKKFAV